MNKIFKSAMFFATSRFSDPKEMWRGYINTGVIFINCKNSNTKKILNEWCTVNRYSAAYFSSVDSWGEQGYLCWKYLVDDFFRSNIKVLSYESGINMSPIGARDKDIDIDSAYIVHCPGMDNNKIAYADFFEQIKKCFYKNNIPAVKEDPTPPYRIAILSGGTENIAYQYEITNLIKQLYCDKFGIDFIFEKWDTEAKTATNRKTDIIRRYIKSYDYVIWMDTDAWFNNFDVDIRTVIDRWSTDKICLIVSRDQNNRKPEFNNKMPWALVNAGVLIFKNTKRSFEIMDEWDAGKRDQLLQSVLQGSYPALKDQPALCSSILFKKDFANCINIIPHREIDFFPNERGKLQVLTDELIYHCIGSIKNDKWMKQFQYALNHTLKRMKSAFPPNEKLCVIEKILKNNFQISDDVVSSSNMSQMVTRPRQIRKSSLRDLFIPAGFDLKPTLKPAPNYNDFAHIKWD